MRVGVLTVSDGVAAGTREDRSGPAIAEWAVARGARLAGRAVVPDDVLAIARALLDWCDGDRADVVLTTGGTGLAPRDVTPEATRAVVERDAPGLPELLRATALMQGVSRAALSRGVAGVRRRTLVINLPGSTGAVREALAALDPIIDHAVAVLREEPTDHSPGAPATSA